MTSRTEGRQLLPLHSVFIEKLNRKNYKAKDAVLHFVKQKAMWLSDNRWHKLHTLENCKGRNNLLIYII